MFDSLDNQYSYWNLLMNQVLDDHAHLKRMKVRARDVPYMNCNWKKAIRMKKRYAKKYTACPTEDNLKQMKKWRNEATKLRRKAMKEYWKRKAEDFRTKPREFYKAFKPFLDTRARGIYSKFINLEVNGIYERNQATVANHFASYFSSVAMDIGDPKLLTSTEEQLVDHPSVQAVSQQREISRDGQQVEFRTFGIGSYARHRKHRGNSYLPARSPYSVNGSSSYQISRLTLCRDIHSNPGPVLDEVLPKLAKAKVFTVLDAKDGFYQIKLDKESSLLTTFWTPFGRYKYLRMPQGISSAPEEYQRRQNEALAGLSGIEVIADDILCYGSGETIEDALKDHDSNLLNLLYRARNMNLNLNKKKLRMQLDQVTFMGQSFTSEANRENTVFVWESQQEEAFQTIKNMISSTPMLKYYDVASETTIQCDASESGLGATLLQNGQPVAFASRSLSAVERRYAQIEKECLAIVFACSRFNQYLHGRELTTVETDHKPLVPIFQKSLHSAPKRLQRMLLRLQKYNLHVKYLPGSQMFIADMLSRTYLQADHSQHENIPEYQIFQLSQEQLLIREIANINQVDYMRLSEGTHQEIKQCTITDATLQSLMNIIMAGWPLTKEEIPVNIREYWNYKEKLTVQDGVLYKGMKVIVPASMRPQMIARAHSSHLGPDACVRRARDVLFWPSMADQIKDQVQNCEVCNDFLARQQKEPLMTHKIPETPWSKEKGDVI
ncbi:Retrovirus-related Pol polyprotein [Stylophora pistillata]|uniref:Retrovirus-related Pol polyprotein n=1 Tax=Stylophora pistillata TaxID=50429 RepID=A0A2B4SLY2_STYPI|nr:Retrovirus-related Pol polyprotein [Stylophora pistillata]